MWVLLTNQRLFIEKQARLLCRNCYVKALSSHSSWRTEVFLMNLGKVECKLLCVDMLINRQVSPGQYFVKGMISGQKILRSKIMRIRSKVVSSPFYMLQWVNGELWYLGFTNSIKGNEGAKCNLTCGDGLNLCILFFLIITL